MLLLSAAAGDGETESRDEEDQGKSGAAHGRIVHRLEKTVTPYALAGSSAHDARVGVLHSRAVSGGHCTRVLRVSTGLRAAVAVLTLGRFLSDTRLRRPRGGGEAP